MISEPALWDRMRELAKTHLRAAELEDRALKFEVATRGFYAQPQTVDVRTFMGTWARARRLWSECSGEPLI